MEEIPYEIERKFLIKYPVSTFISNAVDISHIVQTYLESEEKGVTERVRKRTKNAKSVYTHTKKIRVNDMRRIEYEDEIDEREYNELLKRADKRRNVIEKKRICHRFKGQLFEIDLFAFWDDRAVMEIELVSEEQPIDFPPEIRIIKEITSDKRYTNAALAKNICMEKL